MPARMLNVFADEAPDFDRQMGCMAGIFQIFDRRRLLTARGGAGRQARKRLPTGRPAPNSSSSTSSFPVQNSSTPKIILEKTFSKSMTENSSLSIESSRASCSSSSCSSFSSLDGNKSVQQELPYTNEDLFVERPLRSSPSLKGSHMETTSRHPNIDFRDIVKDSINRESGGLTIKTSVKETRRNGLYKDSPRPVLLSKSMDGTYVIGIDRSTNAPANVLESSRPYQDQSRFSCDDRQLLRPVEVQDNKRPSAKSRELPRLSLDSRKESLSPSSHLKNIGYTRIDCTLLDSLKPQESPSHRRASSVVAKLMGLEEAPNSSGMLIADSYGPARSLRPVQGAQNERPSHSPRSTCERPSHSPRSTYRDPGVLQPKIESSVLKSKPPPRILTEAAPWRQQERGVTNSTACEPWDAEVRPRTASVYADIERRLRGLKFFEFNKDFRALRILGALHAKDTPYQNDSNARSVAIQKIGVERTARKFQSPIVIMKPARTTEKPDVSLASAAPFVGLKSLRKLRSRESSSTGKTEGGANEKIHSRIARAHSTTEEPVSSASSPRSSSSLSPRLLQKKADSERRSRPPVPPSPSKKSNEAVSPRGRVRSKPSQVKNRCNDEAMKIPVSKISLAKQVDVSIIDCQKPLGVNSSFIRQSNTASTLNHEDPSSTLASDKKVHPLENVPSPVSVLDTSFYHDGSSPSLRRISESFKDGETHTSDECWNPISLPDTPPSKTSSGISQMKLENLQALIQKLEQLQLVDDEAPNTNDILSSGTVNKDHQYIYEILSASGLLHKELSFTAMPGQLRPSSYPINPELFLILEQTKSDLVTSPHPVSGTKQSSAPNTEKLHRRLIFDLANEIIAQKMGFSGSVSQSMKFLQSNKLSGWQLFKDLCAEIDELQSESSVIKCSKEDDEENMLLAEGALDEMKEWKSFDSELQGMVLDIERSIFKDLIDEVISSEAAEKMQLGQWKLRRQLSFSSIN